MTRVRLRCACVRFATGPLALPDLDVADGERVAVLGPNGSGKTTLVRVLAGVQPVEGERTVGERSSGPSGSRAVAWVAQRPYLFGGSVAWNVALALTPFVRDETERDRRARTVLEELGIAELAGRDAKQLSEGQIVRVAVARALVVEPSLLLLDETLAPLDDGAARRVSAAVLARPGLSILATSPTAAGVARLAPTRTIELSPPTR